MAQTCLRPSWSKKVWTREDHSNKGWSIYRTWDDRTCSNMRWSNLFEQRLVELFEQQLIELDRTKAGWSNSFEHDLFELIRTWSVRTWSNFFWTKTDRTFSNKGWARPIFLCICFEAGFPHLFARLKFLKENKRKKFWRMMKKMAPRDLI
jgi:hypothetical protein